MACKVEVELCLKVSSHSDVELHISLALSGHVATVLNVALIEYSCSDRASSCAFSVLEEHVVLNLANAYPADKYPRFEGDIGLEQFLFLQ